MIERVIYKEKMSGSSAIGGKISSEKFTFSNIPRTVW